MGLLKPKHGTPTVIHLAARCNISVALDRATPVVVHQFGAGFQPTRAAQKADVRL
jgi:hypothetical protein